MKVPISSTRRQSSWEQRFKELKEFKKKHGHCNVPKRYSLNPALGQWVSGVRKAKRHGMLAEKRVCCLDALGFCWERRTTWEQRIIDLKAFKNKYGHCNVPRRYQPNPALGNWVSNLRQSKKLGELAEERVSCLNALGFVWVRLTTWKEHIHDLMLFKKEYGHCFVPSVYQTNTSLGNWVFKMRQRKKRGKLAEDRILMLDALGFVWEGLKRGPSKHR